MEKLILAEDEIVKICARLGHEIDDKLKDSEGVPIVVGIMNGALPFMYELVKHIEHPIQLDTMKVSSYDGTGTTGKVTVSKEPDHDLEGRDVIIVEEYVKQKYKPKNLYVCILVKRNNLNMKYDETADFIGLTTDEQRYIVGFGFDYFGLFRNRPYVFVPSVKDMKDWDALLEEDKKLSQKK